MSDKKKLIDSDSEDEPNEDYYTPPEARKKTRYIWDETRGLIPYDSPPSPPREQLASGYSRLRADTALPESYPAHFDYSQASTSGYQQLPTSGLSPSESSLRPIRRSDLNAPIGAAAGFGQPSTSGSVRPKPMPKPPPISPPRSPPFAIRGQSGPFTPSPPKYTNPNRSADPTPEIVRRFRNLETGSPDVDKMRQEVSPLRFDTGWGQSYELARRSRSETDKLYDHNRHRTDRKLGLLARKGLRFDEDSKRWSGRPGPRYEGLDRPVLIPGDDATRRALLNRRFYRPQREMSDRPRSDVMPIGRLDFGPIGGPNELRRSYSLNQMRVRDSYDDPRDYTPREQAFSQRLRSLSETDLNRYKTYRSEANLPDNPLAKKRMIKPATGTNILDADKKALAKMKSQSFLRSHDNRRKSFSKRFVLPSSLSRTTMPLHPLEDTDESQTEDYETEEETAPLMPERIRSLPERAPFLTERAPLLPERAPLLPERSRDQFQQRDQRTPNRLSKRFKDIKKDCIIQ